MFELLAGNSIVKEYLARILKKNKIGNSFLFTGPEGVGKTLFAVEFAKNVLCLDDHLGKNRQKIDLNCHPDLHVYKPEGKTGMHSIDSMRQFSMDVYMPPMLSKKKAFIIQDAERMLPFSANALLKTFEEPSLDSLIILVSSRPSSLLQTILSRCRKLYFQNLSCEDITWILQSRGVELVLAKESAEMSQGSLSKALQLMKPEFSRRRDKILKALAFGLKDYMQLSLLAQDIGKEVESAGDEWAALLREEMMKGFVDKPTAIQQLAIEKEIDGAVAMRERSEASFIFEIILSWYRDLEVLKTCAKMERLINKDYGKELVQSFQRGLYAPVQSVFKSISQVQQLLERSTSLTICLENLFLKLNLL